MLKQIAIVIFTIGLTLVVWQTRTPAQSVVNLQADVNRLRQQVFQLQSQMGQLNGRPTIAAPSGTVPRRTQGAQLSTPELLDRLAELAVEAKDRLNKLEARVTKLEQRPVR